ncbi:hypothetical protein ACIQCN_15125 [Pseudarthrobacter sp. NPDC092424]|uniref:hypothetical protein n=1 Tax=Pseudarthrobacter sp. NPDC092424 TaxID=3364415 RepID=UPI00380B87F3
MKVDERTLIWDAAEHTQVMWLEGFINLPVGSVIQLQSSTAPTSGEATVTGATLLAGDENRPLTLRLDCEVSEGWNVHYEAEDV